MLVSFFWSWLLEVEPDSAGFILLCEALIESAIVVTLFIKGLYSVLPDVLQMYRLAIDWIILCLQGKLICRQCHRQATDLDIVLYTQITNHNAVYSQRREGTPGSTLTLSSDAYSKNDHSSDDDYVPGDCDAERYGDETSLEPNVFTDLQNTIWSDTAS